mgnify:CR=1 FL=1
MGNAVTFQMWQERQDLCHKFSGKHLRIGGKNFCYTQKWAIAEGAQWLIDRLFTPCSVRTHPYCQVIRNLDRLLLPLGPQSLLLEGLLLAVM